MTKEQIRAFVATPKGKLLVASGQLELLILGGQAADDSLDGTERSNIQRFVFHIYKHITRKQIMDDIHHFAF